MASVTMENSRVRAKTFDAWLRASDERLRGVAAIITLEGSAFWLRDAFLIDDPDDPDYLWMLCEHHEVLVFPKDELEYAGCGRGLMRSHPGPLGLEREEAMALPENQWRKLVKHARKQFSQCGEEGIIERIFELIGPTNKVAVEFGCGDGFNLSNTRFLVEQGWTAHMWDSHYESEDVRKHLITAENVNEIFAQYEIPRDFDFLSLDIDGNDYWIWKALEWEPRVVLVEFNAALGLGRKCTIPYSPDFRHDGTNYYGASFEALCHLGRQKGYVPVCQLAGLNLFFVRKELVPEGQAPSVAYVPQHCHPPDTLGRPWEEIGE